MAEMLAIASFLTFTPSVPGMSPPLLSTGLAAPMFVPGDMNERFAARVMNVPALAARPPAGVPHTITGTGDSRKVLVICDIEARLPPGVSSSMITAGAPSRSAREIPSARYCAITPSTSPVVGRTTTAGVAARAGPANAPSATISTPAASGMERARRIGRRIWNGLRRQYAPAGRAGPRDVRGPQSGGWRHLVARALGLG